MEGPSVEANIKILLSVNIMLEVIDGSQNRNAIIRCWEPNRNAVMEPLN